MLQKADLSGADLKGANLTGADLDEANLEGAQLQMAQTSGAFMQNTNLKETKGSEVFLHPVLPKALSTLVLQVVAA